MHVTVQSAPHVAQVTLVVTVMATDDVHRAILLEACIAAVLRMEIRALLLENFCS